jgi:hypothetical protein
MPQYMLSIYVPAEGGLSPEEQAAEGPQWFEYTEGLRNAGVFVAGDALHDVSTATTVRVRDGETQIIDGPFAETKEFLGGYYVIDVPDLDAALQHAAGIPSVGRGSVEVRPVVNMEELSGAAEAGAAAQA